jgi:hypothetical protein
MHDAKKDIDDAKKDVEHDSKDVTRKGFWDK